MNEIMTVCSALAGELRERANRRDEESPNDPVAAGLRFCADLVERRAAEYATHPISIAEAAESSGYSEAHLRELAHEGVLQLVDGPGPMRVRRGHLPRKPGLSVRTPALSTAAADLVTHVDRTRS